MLSDYAAWANILKASC